MRLIDADKLKKHYAWWEGGSQEMTLDRAKQIFDTIVDLQKTVDAVRHGHNTGECVRWFRCSECDWGFNDIYMTDESNIDSFPKYCPNCGAKMDEVEE